jgi:hypothetical protein
MKVIGSMSAIDEDKSLSSSGKADEKRKVAEAAIVALEKSKSLDKARSAIEDQVKRWDKDCGLTPKPPESISEAMIQAEIRSHLASLKPEARLAFIDSHAAEVANAVLGSAPSFLSGLSAADLDVARQRIAMRTNPEIAKAKSETLKALADAERGCRNAARSIRECGGLKRDENGGAEDAA